jgi:spore coat protein H
MGAGMSRGARYIASLLLLLLLSGGPLACSSETGWSLPEQCQGLTRGAHTASTETHVEEDGLPVFNLFLADSLPDDEGYTLARLVYRERCHTVKVRLRGDTSRAFPKRSYTLEFPEHAPFDEPLLGDGLTGRRKVVLISPFNDNSYLRARLAFELWNRMSADHIQVKTYSAVVYVNGTYVGLYTVADHINKHLLAARGLDPEGELFKASGDDANFSRRAFTGEPKAHLHQGFEKKAGPSESFEGIEAFTAFVADASAGTFRNEWATRLEAREYEDWWIFVTLLNANDSVAKNAYHYRPRGSLARWRPIPWDLDASLGQNWDTRRNEPMSRADFTDKNHLFARMLEEPSISGPMRERYRALLQGALRVEVVLGLIDAYAREIAPAAHRDEARWTRDYRSFFRWGDRTDFTTHDEEVEYLKQWVRTRWGALEQRLP